MSVDIADIIKQLQKSQDAANLANEQRYAAGLGVLDQGAEAYRGLYDQARESSGMVGRQAMQDVGMAAGMQQSQGVQNLTSRGLGNTTITSAASVKP